MAETKAKILVVDDERNIRRTLRMVLESEDYEVLDAPTAEDGSGTLTVDVELDAEASAAIGGPDR